MAVRRTYDKILPVVDAVEAYGRRALGPEDAAFRQVKERAQSMGVPSITPEAGRMLGWIAAATGARRAVELGTGTGYSGMWIARGLPRGGRLVTVEGDPARAEMARKHFGMAGVSDRVHVDVGMCLDVVRGLRRGSVDLLFIDAAKREYPDYLTAAERCVGAGGVVAADNLYWQGSVLRFDPNSSEALKVQDPDLAGILEFTRRIARAPWTSHILPFGDGLSISVKARSRAAARGKGPVRRER